MSKKYKYFLKIGDNKYEFPNRQKFTIGQYLIFLYHHSTIDFFTYFGFVVII